MSEEKAGLTMDEAARRLRTDGPNQLPSARPPSLGRALLAQLTHFFALVLWVAAVLAFFAGMPELALGIVVIVCINAIFAFVQEYRAERAAARLRDLLPRRATVVRGGQRVEIDAAELVRGDLVALGSGDRVSADLEAVEVHGLSLDVSTLTGESVPERPEAASPILAGCFVVEGEALAVVRATGAHTRLANIARLAQETPRPPPPLRRDLERVVRTITMAALAIGASALLVTLVLGRDLPSALIFAIGVTVATVPEALLPTVTFSLALGAGRMASRGALVRRLESVEALGSTTFVCTDKTGTLTRNQMEVVEVWTPAGSSVIRGEGYAPTAQVNPESPEAGEALARLARVAVRCVAGRAVPSDDGGWRAMGDPMEAAIDALAQRVLEPSDRLQEPERRRFPFDPRRRRSSLVVGDELLVIGAPDTVLPTCSATDEATRALDELARRGLRTLAVACRRLTELPADAEAAERDLRLLGLLGMMDPPRSGSVDAIAACRRAGVRLAMLTGDHPETAAALAREVGLATYAPVLVGSELPEDEAELAAAVDVDGVVIARVTPEQKLRIARALRQRGHVVAMTGDGVNDGPALREADIGVAMGKSGTDVAREAADLVLLDDDFATLVVGIEEGRAMFSNVRRFLTYHLTDNVAELTPFVVWGVSGGNIPLALGVVQVLALDIGTDTFSAVALGAEPPRWRALEGPAPRGHILDRSVIVRALMLIGPLEAMFAMGAFFASLTAAGWRPGAAFPTGAPLAAASGAAFATVVLAQSANAFACRSTTVWPGRLGWTTNRLLLVAVLFGLVLGAAFLWIPPLAKVLGHAAPPAVGWAVAVASMPAVLLVDVAWKAWRRRRSSRST